MAPSFHIPQITLPSRAGDAIAPDQLDLLRQACLDHGFFLLNNEDGHGGFHIAPEQIGRVWSAAADLFDAPLDAKRAVSVASSANNRGYFSSADHAEYNKDPAGVRIKDNKEGFFFGSDNLIAPGNRVPAGKAAAGTEMEGYMEAGRAACVAVMRAIVTAGLLAEAGETCPDAFQSRYLSDPVYMAKCLKYPPSNGNTDAHTDYGCITLLLPGDSGLEVHVGGAWHAVPFAPGAFVINFGDLLSAWSRGAVRSTIHRVIYNSAAGAPRYSLPLFLHPNRGTMVRTPGGAAAGGSVGGFGRPVGDGSGDVVVDTYSYVLSRFDATYKHRAAAAGAGNGVGTHAMGDNAGAGAAKVDEGTGAISTTCAEAAKA
ncbi:hypothetical protein CHLRE_09g403550v5 [Chlamydomonas reinhardtii]|uniref:Uncharacterized protein n=1 Tax=Chlamydomonas reinhardtii TaxID=3055 RepID=A8J1L9_CHLRE|nr:uncharacterized protein CHLRE_09g403550v5 [Chlamydomonas reinhardtii]PNW78286.1 hypothetical protein CHLRE_09g403550v5 [Chlamydomonas reinhardtii]|eukprot:XP_001695234.1 Fe/2-OG dependent oxidoreductase [Chlamydomonas reinhardtii]